MKPQLISILIVTTIFAIAFGEAKILAQTSDELGTLKVKPHVRDVSQRETFPDIKDINLSDEQKKQILQIRQEILPQVSKLIPQPQLTEEQKNQFQSGQSVQITLQAPTAEQKAKLQELMQLYMQKIEAVLTTEQRQKFRENEKDIVLFEQRVNW
jgi:Spy/CpxP family protein refolding chaperone